MLVNDCSVSTYIYGWISNILAQARGHAPEWEVCANGYRPSHLRL